MLLSPVPWQSLRSFSLGFGIAFNRSGISGDSRERGANSDRCLATLGHAQRLSVQLNSTSGDIQRRLATVLQHRLPAGTA